MKSIYSVEIHEFINFRLNVDIEKVLSDPHVIFGLRPKVNLASAVVVMEAYNDFLAMTSAQAAALPSANALSDAYSRHSSKVSSFWDFLVIYF